MTRRTVRALEDRGIGAIESIAPLIQRGDDLTHHSSIRTERRSGHGQAGKVGDKVWLLGLTTWLLQCRRTDSPTRTAPLGYKRKLLVGATWLLCLWVILS